MTSPLNIIQLALKASGCIGEGQTPDASQTNDAFFLLNSLLSEWQLFRFVVYDLVDVSIVSQGAVSYTVGPTGDFVTPGSRPDKIDAAFVSINNTDTYLYPFMSREGYDRIINKALFGQSISYFYDPSLTTNGTLFIWPVTDNTYSIHINCKAYLGQFSSLTETITLPRQYITALMWNLAAQLRPIFGLPAEPQVQQRAIASLAALNNSISQVPQSVQATPSDRAGIYSTLVPGQQQ